MDAGVGGDVDVLDRSAGDAEERFRQLALRRGEREHRAIVVPIRMKVEESRRPERALDHLEHSEIPALAHVGNGHQKRRLGHRPEG